MLNVNASVFEPLNWFRKAYKGLRLPTKVLKRRFPSRTAKNKTTLGTIKEE